MAKPRKPRSTAKSPAGASQDPPKTDKSPVDQIEDAEVVDETAGASAESKDKLSGAQGDAKPGDDSDAATDADDTPQDAAEKTGDDDAKVADEPVLIPDTHDKTSGPDDGLKPDPGDTPGDSDAPKPDFVMSDPPAGDAQGAVAAEDKADTREPSPHVPAIAAPPPQQQRSGFMPMVLGGVIAAVLGAGALYLSHENGWITLSGGDTEALSATIAAQNEEITALQAALDTARADITALETAEPDTTALTALQDQLAQTQTALTALQTEAEATATRLSEVETQPIPAAELPAEVVRAYETKLSELQAALDARLATMQTALDTRFSALETAQDTRLTGIETAMTARMAEIEAAQAATTQLEQNAIDTARAAEARAALAELDAALDAGTGFADALESLRTVTEAEIPAVLTEHAETGVPTLVQLQTRFPQAARTALADANRAARDSGEVSGLTAFFRTQMGARSLEPREGDDPDAVLSRAEAALNAGDLGTAISEIEALPPEGQAALTDWVADAQTLQSAQAAFGTLADQINNN